MKTDSKPRLKLYHSPPSRSSIAMWMLEELGEPYDIEIVSIKAGDNLKPAYLAINPMGKVPALSDAGVIITENAAICAYLADTYPKAGLAPNIGDPARGPYLKWLFFGPSCFEPAMIDKALNRPAGPRATPGWVDFETTLDVVEKALEQSPYIVGSNFTAADVVMGSNLRWGMMFKMVPERPRFVDYVGRLSARPAMKRQIAKDETLAAAITA